MHTGSKLTTLLTGLLVLSSGALGWYLLELLAANSNVLSGTTVIVLKSAILIGSFAILILLFNIAKTSYKIYFEEQKIEEIIEKAAVEPELTRSAIVRLRSVLDPDKHKFADSLATLLDQLLSTIDAIRKEREVQYQTNVELSQKHQQLSKEHEQLKKAPRLKSEFISRMGDEITIPMNNLEEMLSLINQHDHSSNVKELLVIASQAAHSLIENITNIIELNKLDANLYELPKARIMTDELIEKVFLKQENTALSKSLLLEKELGYGVPKSFIANEQAVSKILNNLMSNALRFTSEGSVELKIETATQDEKAMLKFTVSDTGVGIPPEALESIFDSLDKDTKLKNSSFTGRLRLIVCKQLAELMGGTMGVRSVEGEGSQFWFTIAIV